MLVLPKMNVQTPLQNTEPATETASQLKQPSALQALVARLGKVSRVDNRLPISGAPPPRPARLSGAAKCNC